jgi:hypothetical protein
MKEVLWTIIMKTKINNRLTDPVCGMAVTSINFMKKLTIELFVCSENAHKV